MIQSCCQVFTCTKSSKSSWTRELVTPLRITCQDKQFSLIFISSFFSIHTQPPSLCPDQTAELTLNVTLEDGSLSFPVITQTHGYTGQSPPIKILIHNGLVIDRRYDSVITATTVTGTSTKRITFGEIIVCNNYYSSYSLQVSNYKFLIIIYSKFIN